MTAEEVQRQQDLTKRHYQPASRTSWCGAVGRALERNDGTWRKVKCTTNVSEVTCPDCLDRIRNAVKT